MSLNSNFFMPCKNRFLRIHRYVSGTLVFFLFVVQLVNPPFVVMSYSFSNLNLRSGRKLTTIEEDGSQIM